ncbi:MAG: histidine kinase [Acidimicrobiales bacterium]
MAAEHATTDDGRNPGFFSRGPSWPIVERRRSFHAGPGPHRRADEPLAAPARRASMFLAPSLAPWRWASVAVGLGLAFTQQPADVSPERVATAIALVIYAAFRTVRPIDYEPNDVTARAVMIEFGFHTAALLATGTWTSPFAFVLAPTVVLAGLVQGPSFAVRLTAVSSAVITVGHLMSGDREWMESARASAVFVGFFVVLAIAVGLARNALAESARQQTMALDRLGRLAEANSLLFSLHRVAQTLPASLELPDVLRSTIAQLRELVDFDAATIFLLEESDATWVPAHSSGTPFRRTLTEAELPPPLRQAKAAAGTVSIPELSVGGPGLHPDMRCGLYSALHARGALIGLIAVESRTPGPFPAKDVELLNGLVEPFGVSIDNARWFARLRTIGADEERSRIARDLHDQIGQALAHLGFELDRVVRAADRGQDMRPILDELRVEVRSVVRSVRETLYDLRTDVTDTQDFGSTMELYLDRVRERSGLDVALERHETARLPLVQEREVWRIAKEAVTNVERHARASQLRLRWQCDPSGAELVVTDDGRGFTRDAVRTDSYGIIGMRERASTLGARFEVDSTPGAGTTVRVTLSRDGSGALDLRT